MDYQGLDHKETYQRDEQEFQNRREYIQQKRHIHKKQLCEDTFSYIKDKTIQKRYGQPEFYNLNAHIDEDIHIEPERQLEVNWMDKYRVKPCSSHEPKISRPTPAAVPFIPPPTILARLVRTEDKADNIERSIRDDDRRRSQLIEMQKRIDYKKELKRKEQRVIDEDAAEMLAFTVGEKDFEKHFANDYAEILLAHEKLPPIYQEHKYPHTLRETNYLRLKMNRTKREIRDEMKLRAELATELHQIKVYGADECPEAESLSMSASSISEQSSDDEDALSIGDKSMNKFQLRGFHYRMGDELRGRDDVLPKSKHERPERRCQTRKEWFDQLAPSNALYSFFKNNESSLPNQAEPTDDDYCIFSTEPCVPRPIDISPIKDMIENVKEEPRIVDAKVPKIRKPKYLKVKKFNLTGYLFGAPKRYKQRLNAAVGHTNQTNKIGISFAMISKCDALFKKKYNKDKIIRQNRMRTLGIPIIAKVKSEAKMVYGDYENSLGSTENSSKCSDWIPPVDLQLKREPAGNESRHSLVSGI